MSDQMTEIVIFISYKSIFRQMLWTEERVYILQHIPDFNEKVQRFLS